MPLIRQKHGPVSEHTLRQLASRSGALFYHTLMLKEAAARCTEPRGQRSLETDIAYQMAVECFLLHFRKLRDFLYPHETLRAKSGNIIAFDYDSRWLKTDRDWEPCSDEEPNRINNLLGHVSRSEPDGNWPIQVMQERLMQRFSEFVGALPPQRQDWFRPWAL